MAHTLADPHSLLEALRSGTAVPELPAEAVEQARALAREPAAAAPEAVAALPEPLALALLEGAVLAASPTLPEALSHSTSKSLAKAARKALYRLRSRGVAVPESKPSPPASERPAASAPPEALPAFLSSVDGITGERIVVVAHLLRGGGVEAHQLLLSDTQGVVRLDTATTSRKGYRHMLRHSAGSGAEGGVEIGHAEALERLAAAAALNRRSRTPYPEGLESVLRRLGVEPREHTPELPPPEPEDERRARQGHTLHELEVMATWLPSREERRRMLLKVDELEASPLQLTAVQRREQLKQIAYALAHAQVAEPQGRQLWALRLWDSASYLERLGQAEPAQVARAEARRLFHGVQEPPSRFMEALYEKALALELMSRGATSAKPPGPASSAEPAHSPSPERRSPGGLILP